MITLVLGGARSGKSTVAERLVDRMPGPITYVATGTATDPDMAERIRAHQERRPVSWSLVEQRGPHLLVSLAALEGTVLLDSLGTWVASMPSFDPVLGDELCRVLAGRHGDSVVVSEEVGLGVHPSSEVGRRFRDDLGRLNTAVAEVSGEVLLVVAGRVLPLERR